MPCWASLARPPPGPLAVRSEDRRLREGRCLAERPDRLPLDAAQATGQGLWRRAIVRGSGGGGADPGAGDGAWRRHCAAQRGTRRRGRAGGAVQRCKRPRAAARTAARRCRRHRRGAARWWGAGGVAGCGAGRARARRKHQCDGGVGRRCTGALDGVHLRVRAGAGCGDGGRRGGGCGLRGRGSGRRGGALDGLHLRLRARRGRGRRLQLLRHALGAPAQTLDGLIRTCAVTCHRCGAVRDQAAPQVTSSCSNSRGVAVAASRVCRRAGWALPLGLAKPEQYNLTLHLEPRHFRPAAAAQPVNASAELTLDVMRRTSCLVRGAARCGARCAGARPRPRRAWAPACRCPARGRRAGGAAGAPAPQPRKSTTPVLCAGRGQLLRDVIMCTLAARPGCAAPHARALHGCRSGRMTPRLHSDWRRAVLLPRGPQARRRSSRRAAAGARAAPPVRCR